MRYVFYVLALLSLSCSHPTQVLQINSLLHQGSGFVVAETTDSWIVATAAHCVHVGVILVEGELSTVIAENSSADVALVRVPKHGRVYQIWQLADAVQGERIMTYGWVQVSGHEPTMAEYVGWVISADWDGYVAYNAGGWPGCSGGPVVRDDGCAVGVVSRYGRERGQLMDSTVLAAPASAVRALMEGAAL